MQVKQWQRNGKDVHCSIKPEWIYISIYQASLGSEFQSIWASTQNALLSFYLPVASYEEEGTVGMVGQAHIGRSAP